MSYQNLVMFPDYEMTAPESLKEEKARFTPGDKAILKSKLGYSNERVKVISSAFLISDYPGCFLELSTATTSPLASIVRCFKNSRVKSELKALVEDFRIVELEIMECESNVA